MKIVLAGLMVLTLTVVGSVWADDKGGYVSLTGALVMASDSDFTEQLGNQQIKGTHGYDSGFGILGAVGLAFDNGFRGELELGYRSRDVEDVTYEPFSYTNDQNQVIRAPRLKAKSNADIRTLSVMTNGRYYFKAGGWPVPLSPYVGVGIGWAQHTVSKTVSTITYQDPKDPDNTLTAELGVPGDSANVFAYQGMVGVVYVLADVELSLGYRLFGTTNAKLREDTVDAEYTSHNLELGVVFRF